MVRKAKGQKAERDADLADQQTTITEYHTRYPRNIILMCRKNSTTYRNTTLILSLVYVSINLCITYNNNNTFYMSNWMFSLIFCLALHKV